MTELEKVIMGLECCKKDGDFCYDKKCPYKKNFPKCIQSLMDDTLSLLKAQEPARPIIKQEMDDICSCIDNIVYCGRCGARIGRLKQNYCLECGQAVKWDG